MHASAVATCYNATDVKARHHCAAKLTRTHSQRPHAIGDLYCLHVPTYTISVKPIQSKNVTMRVGGHVENDVPRSQLTACATLGGVGLEYDLVLLGLYCYLRLYCHSG